jgi:transposase
MYDNVPSTNSQGERDIRVSKDKQKVSGYFRSLLGADCPRARSFVYTAVKHGFNAMDALIALFNGEDAFVRRLAERR